MINIIAILTHRIRFIYLLTTLNTSKIGRNVHIQNLNENQRETKLLDTTDPIPWQTNGSPHKEMGQVKFCRTPLSVIMTCDKNSTWPISISGDPYTGIYRTQDWLALYWYGCCRVDLLEPGPWVPWGVSELQCPRRQLALLCQAKGIQLYNSPDGYESCIATE